MSSSSNSAREERPKKTLWWWRGTPRGVAAWLQTQAEKLRGETAAVAVIVDHPRYQARGDLSREGVRSLAAVARIFRTCAGTGSADGVSPLVTEMRILPSRLF